MPEIAMWSLIVSLIVLCLGIVLKAVEYRSLFNKADEETSNLRTELAMLNKKYEKPISDVIKIVNDKPEKSSYNRTDKDQEDIFHNILALIAQYHSQELAATPERIGKDLGLDHKIILAHMDKLHNDQFITFRNDGKPPDVKTAFFLSPKAWEHIAVVKKE